MITKKSLLLLSTALAFTFGQARAADVAVTIESMQFAPTSISVKTGDTVTWTNKDLFPHTVTSATKRFDSKSIAAGGTWKFVVKKKGTFPYRCAFHPTMKGELVVK